MTGKEKPIANVVDDIRIQSWNTCIAPRAEPLLSYLRQDIYQRGPRAYFKAMETLGERKLLTGCKSTREDDFMRGYLVALKEVIALEDAVESTVNAKKNPQAPPSDYTESA